MSEDSNQLAEDKKPEAENNHEPAPERPNELTGETTKWNQNKKIPRIFPGLILSIIFTILMPIAILKINAVLATAEVFIMFLLTVYWTFCVFRLTGQLQYKSKALKIADRTMALLLPLLGNPSMMVLFLGTTLAVSALSIASFFGNYRSYMHGHSGSSVTLLTIALLVFSISLIVIPIVEIPTICMGWTYKFMVKVASVNEPIEKRTFWKTRGPAILVLVNTFVCVEGWLIGLLSFGAPDIPYAEITVLGFLTCGLCQAINFAVLWRCVRKKEALNIVPHVT